MEKLSVKMQKMILWITSYANMIALVLCGGYILRFGEDERVKKTAVKAFIVNAIFIVINNMILPIVILIVDEFGSASLARMFDTNNGQIVIFLLVVKIVIYAVAMIRTLCEKNESTEEF